VRPAPPLKKVREPEPPVSDAYVLVNADELGLNCGWSEWSNANIVGGKTGSSATTASLVVVQRALAD